MTIVPRHNANELEKILNVFLRESYFPRIKHETLCNNYKRGSLKNIGRGSEVFKTICFMSGCRYRFS